VRVSKVLKTICGFTREVVVMSAEVVEGIRPALLVQVGRRSANVAGAGVAASWRRGGAVALSVHVGRGEAVGRSAAGPAH
jgi:hypothetical protein